MLQQGGKRRKNAVIKPHQQHCLADIFRGFEGVFPVKGEIPNNRKHQRDQVRNPVFQSCQLIQKGETAHLDNAGRCGKQHKFQRAKNLFFIHTLSPKTAAADAAAVYSWMIIPRPRW